ncbi:hypothetical protein PVAG01_09047 [Phlyctema vagabunda]|uniref:GmrSD restriction endonucleases N-terminal domain-containing protein n=1 Tax=Phlyctema vagabunda TaxID=108571 RepID=A0ABR4P689_9HELO
MGIIKEKSEPLADLLVKEDPDLVMGSVRAIRPLTSRQKQEDKKVKSEVDFKEESKDDAKADLAVRGSPTKSDAHYVRVKIEHDDADGFRGFSADGPDDDPFDDFEYVDDTYEGIAEGDDGIEYFVCKEMKIPQVPRASISMRRLGQLYDISKTKYMNLEPEYQREVVWDEHRASELIKSIFIGFFIPPLIFNLITKIETNNQGIDEKKYYRVCVDGKQRMTSIVKFMDGLIGFHDASKPPKKWFYRHPIINGIEKITNHNIMPDAMKKRFRESEFCCYEYQDLNLATEETMFQLVQRGIALTPAERMKAMSTEWAQFTKKFEEDYAIVVNLSKQNRASGFRVVLTIFTMIQEVMFRAEDGRKGIPTLQSSPQSLNKVLEDKKPISETLKARFKEVFDRFQSLVKSSSTQTESGTWKVNQDTPFDPAPLFLKEEAVNHVKTYSPLELMATGILIAKHMKTRGDELLLGDIREMRHYLREKHKDLRVNAQCWVSAWEFLDYELLRRRGGPGGTPMPNAQRHSQTISAATDNPDAVRTPESSKRTHSRGSTQGSEDERVMQTRSKRPKI